MPVHAPRPSVAQLSQHSESASARPNQGYVHHPRGSIHPQGQEHNHHFQNDSEAQHNSYPGKPHAQQGYSNGYMQSNGAGQAQSFQPYNQQSMNPPRSQQPAYNARPAVQRPAHSIDSAHNPAQYQRARPARRDAHDRHRGPRQGQQGSAESGRASGVQSQHEPEPRHNPSVANRDSIEPSLTSLSMADHAAGQAGRSAPGMRRAREPGRHQTGTGRQSTRAAPQPQQRGAVLAEHTEEHLARLLESSQQAGTLRLAPNGTSQQTRLPVQSRRSAPSQRGAHSDPHLAKRGGRSQSGAPQEKDAEPTGYKGEESVQDGTAAADTEEHGTCVICAEQRQASCPLILLC